jgi:indolepyruvate ferredoxin oxidoreductase beta subunit
MTAGTSQEHRKGKGSNMEKEITNVLIAGVGGQGVLLVSEILSRACMKENYDVKKSEVHGMAQRGGSVVSHIRYGARVRSPLIEKGTAHVLLALEELEALRWAEYLHPDGTIIVNRQRVEPLPVAVGLQEYPRDTLARLKKKTGRLIPVDGLEISRRVGHIRTMNIIMLGALAAHLGFDPQMLRTIIRSTLPRKILSVNVRALNEGWKTVSEMTVSSKQ